MNITDKKENELLVRHIRNTSSIHKSMCNYERVKALASVAPTAPKLQLKVRIFSEILHRFLAQAHSREKF